MKPTNDGLLGGSRVLGRERRERGSTLAEVMIGMVVLAFVVLAVMGILIQSSYLEQSDTPQTEILALAQGLLEVQLDQARVLEGFRTLESISTTPTSDSSYLYQQQITQMPLHMKKISVSIFYADPTNPNVPNLDRVRGGRALTLSVAVVEPTT